MAASIAVRSRCDSAAAASCNWRTADNNRVSTGMSATDSRVGDSARRPRPFASVRGTRAGGLFLRPGGFGATGAGASPISPRAECSERPARLMPRVLASGRRSRSPRFGFCSSLATQNRIPSVACGNRWRSMASASGHGCAVAATGRPSSGAVSVTRAVGSWASGAARDGGRGRHTLHALGSNFDCCGGCGLVGLAGARACREC